MPGTAAAAAPTGAGAALPTSHRRTGRRLPRARRENLQTPRRPASPADGTPPNRIDLRIIRPIYGDDPAAVRPPGTPRGPRSLVAEGSTSQDVINGRTSIASGGSSSGRVSHRTHRPRGPTKAASGRGAANGATRQLLTMPLSGRRSCRTSRRSSPCSPRPVRALLVVQLHSGGTGRRTGQDCESVTSTVLTRTSGCSSRVRTRGPGRGKSRTIYFGERCREALAPLILKAGSPEAYVFSPAREEIERLAETGGGTSHETLAVPCSA